MTDASCAGRRRRSDAINSANRRSITLPDGRVVLAGTEKLAGSALRMDRGSRESDASRRTLAA